jgi:hypothetical protein
VRIEGIVRELYDVAFIPGIRNPSAIVFKSDEIQQVIAIDENRALLQHEVDRR